MRSLLAALLLTACAEESLLLLPAGSIEFGPRQVAFPDTAPGARVDRLVHLYNLTDEPITIETFELNAPEALVLGYGRERIEARDRIPIDVSFRPTELGEHRGEVIARGFGVEATLTLFGRATMEPAAPSANLRCAPEALDLGQVPTGRCHRAAIECRADRPTQITASTSGPFQVRDGTGQTPIVLQLEVCPAGVGNLTDTLTVRSSEEVVRIPLSARAGGGAPMILVQPEMLQFPTVLVGSEAHAPLQITNTGDARLEVQAATMPPFSAPPSLAVDPGATERLPVRFAPEAAARFEWTMRLTTNDPQQPVVEIQMVGVGEGREVCELAGTPNTAAFGGVPVGESAVLSILVTNLRDRDCQLDMARVSGGGFTLLGPPPTEIGPEATISLAIRFAPTSAGQFAGELAVEGGGPPLRVPLSGSGLLSNLSVVPSELDFGVSTPDCPAGLQQITVTNNGYSQVTITQVQTFAFGSPPGSFSVNTTLPLMVADGASVTLPVAFSPPPAAGLTVGYLLIIGTIEGAPFERRVGLRAEFSPGGSRTDTFLQDQTDQVDVLIVMDNSNSMGEEQAAIGSNFSSFIQFAEQGGLDYQIGVTTTDTQEEAGRLLPVGAPQTSKIITPMTTPSPATVFEANVNAGTDGWLIEQGLEAAYLALSQPLVASDNAGFLRPDAALLLIFVSDENDASPRTLDFYENFFVNLKNGDRSLVTAIAIIGDVPAGCATATGGLRYDEMVSRLGGLTSSICSSDWSQTLSEISRTAFGLRIAFGLSGQPDPASIVVRVDGVVVSNWTYDAQRNEVVFLQVPSQGSIVEVDYDLGCP